MPTGGGAGAGVGAGWLAWDCAVFAVFVGATTCAPLWRRRRDKAGSAGGAKLAYVFAGGGVSTFAMILSVARGTLGVRSFLGYPSELVYHGAAMWETLYGMCLAFPLVSWLLVPLYWRLHTTSVYEYLELRFGSVWVRRAASGTFVVRQVLNLAVTVYTPCVALHAVLALPHWASAAALTAVAAGFTLLGGLTAAIRADVIQTVAMVLISAVFIVQATVQVGGPARVLQENIDGGRLEFFKFTWDPRTRVDCLSAIVGQLFISMSVYGCQQTFVQRYISMRSLRAVRRTLWACGPAVGLLFSLSWLVGCALYALYRHCDPLAAGVIAAPDEVLPYYVRDQFTFLPGTVGLFLGCLFNGALSFLVSNVNSLATVTWEDFVSAAPSFRGIGDEQQVTVIKVIGILYALLIMCLSLLVGLVGGVIEGSMLVTSATTGALLGVFVLAVACPLATGRGALAGMLAAHTVTFALAAGRLVHVDTKVAMLPLHTDGCLNDTVSAISRSSLPLAVNQTLLQLAPLLRSQPTAALPHTSSTFNDVVMYLFSISYMWYAVIGTFVCVLVGNMVGALSVVRPHERFDDRLLHPVAARLARRLPAVRGARTYRSLDDALAVRDTKPPAAPLPPSDKRAAAADTSKPSPLPERAGAVPAGAATLSATGSRLFDAYQAPSAPSPPPPPPPPAQRTRF